MRTVDMREQEIFLNALEISSSVQRKDYLYQACGNNISLRSRVEDLLRHHQSESFILDKNIALDSTGAVSAQHPEPSDLSGTSVGRYHLVKKIGSGGMGDVYLAEQKEPIRRRVAVKIIKLGLDTKNFVIRFAAERQALALMDHSGITKVFDAGATETGRPFFVMELVSGQPITSYCDENHLGLSDRIEIFVELCKAIQHAHQKGVIHRDLKPSNILVGKKDQEPTLKVIDFGVSKATTERIPGQTDLTRMACMIGTPEYMSPEQTDTQGNDQDIRTDIYSLGSILYQLLSGTTPFELEKLSEKKIFTVREIIQTRHIDWPSVRVTKIVDTKPQTFRDRNSSPGKLPSQLKGNLDAICKKCLSKDRSQRYHTVAGLINDLRLHQQGLLASCVKNGIWNQLKTFTRRNKHSILVTGIVATILLGITAFSFYSITKVNTLQRDKNQAIADLHSLSAESRQAKRIVALQKNKIERLEKNIRNKQRVAKNQKATLLAISRFNKMQGQQPGGPTLAVSVWLKNHLESDLVDTISEAKSGNQDVGDLQLLQLLLNEQKSIYGNSDLIVASTLDLIGKRQLVLKKYSQATEALRESLFIRTDTEDSIENRIRTMYDLSRALKYSGREVDSASYLFQAKRLAKDLPENSRVHEILETEKRP